MRWPVVMRIPNVPLSEILHLVELLILAIAATFAGFQLRALRLQNSADFTLRLVQELETGVNRDLVDALDSEPTTPILRKSGGRFTVERLGDYLGEYETLDDFYRDGLITCRMMYTEFSYDLEKAYQNKDVMAEVAEERKNDPTVWQGFLDLGGKFDKGYNCK
jgi:hypothetical protein